MPKIHFERALLDFYGEPVKAPDTSKEPVGKNPDGSPKFPTVQMTLREACVNALAQQYDGEKLDGSQKTKRWLIGCKVAKAKINKTGVVDMKSEEVTEILKCTDQGYPPLVAGVIRAMLDPSAEDKKALEQLGVAPAA